jgi:putative transposase
MVIRCGNRSECLSSAIVEWIAQWRIELEYLQPGKPQQSAYAEWFNRTVRYEWLSQYHRDDLDHVQRAATEWMWSSNDERPHDVGWHYPKQRVAMTA